MSLPVKLCVSVSCDGANKQQLFLSREIIDWFVQRTVMLSVRRKVEFQILLESSAFKVSENVDRQLLYHTHTPIPWHALCVTSGYEMHTCQPGQ